MKVDYQIKDQGKTEKILTATIPEEAITKAKEFTLKALGKDANIKGFRPGKAPAAALEKHFGTEFVRLKSLDRALQLTYAHIINTEKIQACAMPKVEIDEN